ncbi:Glycolipid transfer protein [Strongyloides ratti]|uniref:Glycolipid transfer protein n=1 Tax=Strongyloides ratti TaxID=34506 RepID=A0A090MWZ2_STRRB|nr:Glycolipid transfer protein [Strongyloides ratti]CEF64529.1 Glycolipid transfer protein [Strongyloides ratti]
MTDTYFSFKDKMFPLLEDEKIPTEQFLSACQGIAEFVGFFGAAFSPVKNDIMGNVIKVRTKYESNTERMPTIQDLIDTDLIDNNGKLGIATEGLLWLKRGLEFMLQMIIYMVEEYNVNPNKEETENLKNVINKAYEITLKRHHNFLAKNLFKLVIHAAPYRRTILKHVALGKEGCDDICIEHITSHLENFRENVASLVNYYYLKKLETRP